MPTELCFMVGGEAGQGVQSVGLLLSKVFARSGYHVFADQDYDSRIRGGHNFFRVRVGEQPVAAIREPLDILVALNPETLTLHRPELTPGGVALYDSEGTPEAGDGLQSFGLPFAKLAVGVGGDRIMTNTVALGAALAVVSYDTAILNDVLARHFGSGHAAIANIAAARAGYDYVREHYRGGLPQMKPLARLARMLLTGNDAMSLGAVAAGCRFMAAYPMTPTTSIMEYLAAHSADLGIAMVHAEDEIAAVHLAIGASYAGVRAMTATSGGGFCLMVEGLGLAGMTETPLVIIDGQRPGPAIGLPTRTEQGDLQFALHAHHGDFPRAVLAPHSIEDCFWTTVRAFNLADRYQLPVIVLTDHYLAGCYATVESFDLDQVTIDRGSLYSAPAGASAAYLRHRITPTGVSPRAFPGAPGTLVVTDSDEHDEAGHLAEDIATRNAQMDKRLHKLVSLRQEMHPPRWYGPRRPDTLLVGWGSTFGALREAVDLLHHDLSIGLLHLNELWPFPTEAVADALTRSRTSYVIENNASGQLAQLIRMETGKETSGRILKYDGRPFTPAYLAAAIRKECDHLVNHS
jgi:2-oxoglutarate ferredoxin oxidoreductase subunit alpha